jgi:hypothetical protein
LFQVDEEASPDILEYTFGAARQTYLINFDLKTIQKEKRRAICVLEVITLKYKQREN